jgi:hypothetical protein
MSNVDSNRLWTLVKGAMDEQGYTYRAVEEATGGRLKRGELGHWRNGVIKHLSPEPLRAAAEVLGLDLVEVVSAALATIGLPSGVSPEQAIREDGSLDEVMKRTLIRDLAAYRARTDQLAARRRKPPETLK